jgi:hypothetical protein
VDEWICVGEDLVEYVARRTVKSGKYYTLSYDEF